MIRIKECLYRWLAYRLPRGVVYYAAIRMWAHASTGQWSNVEAPGVTLQEALTRWDKEN